MYLVDENKIHSFTTRTQTNTIRLGALEGSISINNLYKFTYHFSTIILHEENNSLTLNVLTLLQQ
jgi:hypothetical protein